MTTTRRITIGVALALVLAASVAPAGARPADPNANGSYVPTGLASMHAPSQPAATPTSTPARSNTNTGLCSEVCSGSGYGSRVNRSAATVYSRSDKSLIPVSAPATSGRVVGQAALLRSLAQQKRERVAALSDYREGQIATALAVAATAATKATAPQAVVRIHAPQSAFDWGDAGIGAAGGIALSMIALGGALAVSQNRARRARRTTALPS